MDPIVSDSPVGTTDPIFGITAEIPRETEL